MLNAFLYDGKGHDREVTLGATLPRLSRQKLLWIDVTSPTAENRSDSAALDQPGSTSNLIRCPASSRVLTMWAPT